MIIVMGAGAAQKEIRTVIARIKALGTPAPIFGRNAPSSARSGRARQERPPGARVAPRGGAGRPDPQAVQARKPRGEAGTDGHPHRPGVTVGTGSSWSSRALLRRGRNADDRNGAGVKKAGATCCARGVKRAPPVRLPGLELKASRSCARRGSRGDAIVTEVMNPADVERIANIPTSSRSGRATSRTSPSSSGSASRSGHPPQARDDDDGHGVPDERGVLPVRGSRKVILCERGIRTFEDATRNTLDLSAIPVLKERTTSRSSLTVPRHRRGAPRRTMSCAAVAAGADG